jgi:UDP-N-acetylglucosamine diphosphorylase/glucosamine-1-phosphate N-acetyltransferase
MNYILFDDDSWIDLLPLTFTRPVSKIRCGILTIHDKWEKMLHSQCSQLTQDYLQERYPLIISEDNLLINGSIMPNQEIISAIMTLKPDETLMKDSVILASRKVGKKVSKIENLAIEQSNRINFTGILRKLNQTWDIFTLNADEIKADFETITNYRISEAAGITVNIFGKYPVFIERGAKLQYTSLNTSDGPIYIGKDAEIMEGSLIRGPFALCEAAVIKMGAKIYGGTTIGPWCKVGGEINNSVLFAHSNKAHDGFLGNSVVGEWCNFGADSNNSNLKNNYSPVKMWSYRSEHFIDTELQFCGLIMGDYSKCAINMMFNTGTVVGVNANLFGAGFPRNFIPSFSWGGPQGFVLFSLEKAYEAIDRMKERRGMHIDELEKKMLKHIFNHTKKYRHN